MPFKRLITPEQPFRYPIRSLRAAIAVVLLGAVVASCNDPNEVGNGGLQSLNPAPAVGGDSTRSGDSEDGSIRSDGGGSNSDADSSDEGPSNDGDAPSERVVTNRGNASDECVETIEAHTVSSEDEHILRRVRNGSVDLWSTDEF